MELYVGGYAQEKTTYVMEMIARDSEASKVLLLDERDCARLFGGDLEERIIILQHFHLMVQRELRQIVPHEEKRQQTNGEEADLTLWFQKLTDRIQVWEQEGRRVIVISDEVGNGIVPVDGFEREWREWVGRLLIRLAKQADRVERVICGLGQRIK